MKKEIHIAPLAVAGEFHIGKAMEVVCADTYTRWKLLTSDTSDITFVHDSWNTYVSEHSASTYLSKDEQIAKYQKTKDSLNLLPSADMFLEEGKVEVLQNNHQEFRDDHTINIQLVNIALDTLKNNGIVIPGIVAGNKGLYFDVGQVAANLNIGDLLDGIKIFPSGFNNRFKRVLDGNNESNYLGKIPITKRRTFGVKVTASLLEGENSYFDSRFSPKDGEEVSLSNTSICVSPLIVLALLPYIRSEQSYGERSIDFITNGVGSSLRFNLVSILLNRALGIEQPYQNIHFFDRLDIPGFTLEDSDQSMGNKIRFTIFDQLPINHKVLSDKYLQERDKEWEMFKKRITLIREYLKEQTVGFKMLTKEEETLLRRLDLFRTMESLNFMTSFKRLKEEIAKRSKNIHQGVIPMDSLLLKLVEVFLPGL